MDGPVPIRIFKALLSILASVILLLLSNQAVRAETPVLRVLNWSEYIDIDDSIDKSKSIVERSPTLSSFVKKHGCELEYYEYEDEPLMREKVLSQPGFYDVVSMSLSDQQLFLENGRLSPIPIEKVPNKIHLIPSMATTEADPKGEYFVPFMVGTEGIVYRTDLVGKTVSSWSDYFEPGEHLKGKLGCLNSSETMLAASLKSEGFSINERDPERLRQATRKLFDLKRKGFLTFITSDIGEIHEKLLSGEMAMTVLYSGDALAAVDEDTEGKIAYTLPLEGVQIFMDTFVVLEDSSQKELAYRFLDHILDPEIHAANAAYLQYICPNRSAVEILEAKHPEILENPSIYPPEEMLKKCEFGAVNDLAAWNRLWSRVVD